VCCAAGVVQAGTSHYKSPEEVFATAKAANAKEDQKGLYSCLTGESRDVVAGTMVLVASLHKAFAGIDKDGKDEGKEKAIDEVFAKHGVTEAQLKSLQKYQPGNPNDPQAARKALKKLAELVKDRMAFLCDMTAALKKFDSSKSDGLFAKDAVPRDLQVEGDYASATIVRVRNGEERRTPIAFRRVAGEWRIEIPSESLLVE
jgi:hypothetical protein